MMRKIVPGMLAVLVLAGCGVAPAPTGIATSAEMAQTLKKKETERPSLDAGINAGLEKAAKLLGQPAPKTKPVRIRQGDLNQEDFIRGGVIGLLIGASDFYRLLKRDYDGPQWRDMATALNKVMQQALADLKSEPALVEQYGAAIGMLEASIENYHNMYNGNANISWQTGWKMADNNSKLIDKVIDQLKKK